MIAVVEYLDPLFEASSGVQPGSAALRACARIEAARSARPGDGFRLV
jgi:hypothetical protein